MGDRNSGLGIIHALLAAMLTMLFAQPAYAQLAQPGRNAMSSSLVPETQRVAPGSTVTLALVMQPKPGWHGYWQNPGDAGAGMRIQWELPSGAKAGELQYPVPKTLLISGLMNHVYEDRYVLLVDLKIPTRLAPGTPLPIRGRMDYLACTDEICVPEKAVVATRLVVAPSTGPPADPALFRTARERLPKPLPGEARFEIKDGRFNMVMSRPESGPYADMHFFPRTEKVVEYAAVQTMVSADGNFWIETDAPENAQAPETVEGIFKTGEHEGYYVAARAGPVPPSPGFARSEGPGRSNETILLIALGGALLGGLLLNIMPCVFPILSLKALSLARAGGDEKDARREALAYAAGVILICLLLGAILLALRAGGETVGWAFQLQDPRVILFLLLLVTAIALNFAGLFELPSLGLGDKLAQGGGVRDAFWTGALAAFIATPCTGPFMGAALGAALILPPPAALAVFAGLGLGLALPFLLLGLVPALRRRLPRPGPWMATFRRILSVPMFVTGLGLLWILGRQTGVDGLLLGIGAALVLAFSLAWWARRHWSLALAPAALAALAAILLVPSAVDPVEAHTSSLLSAEPFSEARLMQLQSESRHVFVYFTADWCLTCKVNERGVLARDDVAQHFADQNIAVLVGDWTRGDAAIGRFLEKQGRSGVPLYLYYEPGQSAEILPQLLTAGRLTGLGLASSR